MPLPNVTNQNQYNADEKHCSRDDIQRRAMGYRMHPNLSIVIVKHSERIPKIGKENLIGWRRQSLFHASKPRHRPKTKLGRVIQPIPQKRQEHEHGYKGKHDEPDG